MSYELEILERAKADYRRLYRYLERRSPQGADSWDDAFDGALQRIRMQPLTCGLAPEGRRLGLPLRHAFFRTKHGRTTAPSSRSTAMWSTCCESEAPGNGP